MCVDLEAIQAAAQSDMIMCEAKPNSLNVLLIAYLDHPQM